MRKTRMIVACLLISTSAIAADMDNRQTLSLSEAQRSHVLEEMRALLSGTRYSPGNKGMNFKRHI